MEAINMNENNRILLKQLEYKKSSANIMRRYISVANSIAIIINCVRYALLQHVGRPTSRQSYRRVTPSYWIMDSIRRLRLKMTTFRANFPLYCHFALQHYMVAESFNGLEAAYDVQRAIRFTHIFLCVAIKGKFLSLMMQSNEMMKVTPVV